eukprot:scaffold6322_cov59-Cylindrotheca_fusiformis.AAC.19
MGVSLVATRISRGKHQMPPFPTIAVLLIPDGIHCVGLELANLLFRRPRTSIRQVIEDCEFGVVVARDVVGGKVTGHAPYCAR